MADAYALPLGMRLRYTVERDRKFHSLCFLEFIGLCGGRGFHSLGSAVCAEPFYEELALQLLLAIHNNFLDLSPSLHLLS